MEYIELNNKVQMPILGFGTYNIKGKDGVKTIQCALECGYRLFDTAQMYQNEDIVGLAIAQSGIDRSQIFIISKLDSRSNSYAKALVSIEQSLNSLQSNYIDLMLIHEPYKESVQMYNALCDAMHKHKIRAIGISNFSQARYLDFIKQCNYIPAVNQVESHVYYPQLDLAQCLQKYGTRMQSWGSLTSCKLSLNKDTLLLNLAKKYHCSVQTIALRYLTQQKIAVIPKSLHIEHMQENLKSLDFSLESSDLKLLQGLNTNRSLFNWYD